MLERQIVQIVGYLANGNRMLLPFGYLYRLDSLLPIVGSNCELISLETWTNPTATAIHMR